MSTNLIKDDQVLVGAKSRFGNDIKIYDDGYGPLWIMRDSMGIMGIIRAQTFEDAYGIAEDELFPEASETVEELKKEYSTIYLSGRELWNHWMNRPPFDKWKWSDLSEEGQKKVLATPGRNIPYLGELPDHPCFQEAYGFRPSGPNATDKINHGIYAKDLNGESLDRLSSKMLKDWEITLEIKNTEE
jgi:hypothetical protein